MFWIAGLRKQLQVIDSFITQITVCFKTTKNVKITLAKKITTCEGPFPPQSNILGYGLNPQIHKFIKMMTPVIFKKVYKIKIGNLSDIP